MTVAACDRAATGWLPYEPMALDEDLMAEMRVTKAAIDELQQKLEDIVAALRERGATAQEIAEALRG